MVEIKDKSWNDYCNNDGMNNRSAIRLITNAKIGKPMLCYAARTVSPYLTSLAVQILITMQIYIILRINHSNNQDSIQILHS